MAFSMARAFLSPVESSPASRSSRETWTRCGARTGSAVPSTVAAGFRPSSRAMVGTTSMLRARVSSPCRMSGPAAKKIALRFSIVGS